MMTISQGTTYALAAALAYGVPRNGPRANPFSLARCSLERSLPPPTHGRSRATGISGPAIHLGTVAYVIAAGAFAVAEHEHGSCGSPLMPVLGAIGVGPIFTLPFLAKTPLRHAPVDRAPTG